MSSAITQHNLFRPARPKAETKAENTTSIARAIIDAEAEQREAKTARLRQARLEKEERDVATPPAEPRRKKAAGARRTRSST